MVIRLLVAGRGEKVLSTVRGSRQEGNGRGARRVQEDLAGLDGGELLMQLPSGDDRTGDREGGGRQVRQVGSGRASGGEAGAGLGPQGEEAGPRTKPGGLGNEGVAGQAGTALARRQGYVLARGNVGGQGIGVNPLEGGNRVKDQNVKRTGCLAAVIWLNQTEQMAIPGVAAETKEQHPNVGVSHLTNPLNGRPLLLRDGEAVSRLKVGVPDGAPANNKASIGRPLQGIVK